MSKHLLVVFSKPAPGEEEEYREFFNNTHLSEMAATEGVIAAQRFELVAGDDPSLIPSGFVAIYEIEGNLEAAKEAVSAGRARRTPLPPCVTGRTGYWFTAASDRVQQGSRSQ